MLFFAEKWKCGVCGEKHKMNIRFCSNCGFEKKIYHDNYDVFISYRRDLGSEMAALIKLELEKYGKKVFLDVTELQVGRFDEKLLQVIKSCNAFLLILSPGCLDRCVNKSDWLKREIVHAFKNKKKIIPVIVPGFEWPDKTTLSLLPIEMHTLPQYQAVEYSPVNRREAVRKILEYIAAPQVETSCDENDSLHQDNESRDNVISMPGEQLGSAKPSPQHQGTNFFNEDVSLSHADKLCSLDRDTSHHPAINVVSKQTQRWSLSQGNRPLYGQACEVAIKGFGMLKNIPYSRFGTFYSVDRSELEGLRGIRQLFHDYVRADSDTKPLSIGVFGPTNSGQEFVIQSVVRDVLDSHFAFLEFNLTKFDEPDMLFNALRQVRDKGLEGEIPVVFWHGFDSRELTWLKYFLTSMKDGTFFENQIIRQIGKCIFVFISGTSSTMGQFSPPPENKDYDEVELELLRYFNLKKGEDFISHLQGYVNVMGINPRQIFIRKTGKWETDPTDIYFPIRRARLLRAAAGLHHDGRKLLNIDQGLLNAFLKIGKYSYGARSLGTIISRTVTEKKGQLLRSNLPPREQLSLHVDYDEFFALIQQGEEFQAACEGLARHIHGFYLELCRAKELPITYDMEYDDPRFPLEIKEDNVAAARRITMVLSLISMQVVGKSEVKTKEAENIDEVINENIELLAEAEHDGWMEEKLKNGWRPTNQGEKRNDKLEIHNCLIPYSDLSEKEKDKDRDSVRNYPAIVDRAGYMIVYEE